MNTRPPRRTCRSRTYVPLRESTPLRHHRQIALADGRPGATLAAATIVISSLDFVSLCVSVPGVAGVMLLLNKQGCVWSSFDLFATIPCWAPWSQLVRSENIQRFPRRDLETIGVSKTVVFRLTNGSINEDESDRGGARLRNIFLKFVGATHQSGPESESSRSGRNGELLCASDAAKPT